MEFQVSNLVRSALVAKRVRTAATSKERRRGLLGEQTLGEGAGLWINPCEAIHTIGMRMPIDSIFIDKERRVLKLIANLRPGRIRICLRAQSVLELPPGTIARTGTAVGDVLTFTRLKDIL